MRYFRPNRCSKIVISCGCLFVGAGCLGPNPLFSVGTTAANTTVATLTNLLLNSLFGIGGG